MAGKEVRHGRPPLHLPRPADARARLPPGARDRPPLPPRPRRLASLPLARAPGALGLDARLRRRRPDARVGRARRRGGAARALRGRARGRAGHDPRRRPESHGGLGGGELPLAGARAPRPLLRLGRAERLVPPLLRHRRARRRARRGSRGLRGDARQGARARRRRARRRAPHRPSRRPREPPRVPGAAPRARRRAHLGGEDARARRAAAGRLACRGHDRLRVRERRNRALRRPGRRGAADPAVRRAERGAPTVRRGRPRGEARGGEDDLRALILLEGERTPARDEFVVRWQQTTGPVMAKGVEDRAFYRWFRLTALNEVGGDPDRFSLSPEDFHHGALERLERHPHTLLASQTHDTKRAGDVRARIGALAGMHEEWAERVRRWHALTGGMDDPNEEYLVWQTLVGAWPIVPGRLELYLEKALREAKRTTSWTCPDEAHERRVKRFVRDLYSNQEFLADFEPFAVRVARAGEHASLGALLLRLTSPGLPDLYQGDALWSLNLVDPDNRRPVDWRAHVSALREAAPSRRTLKAHLIRRALALRAERPDAFAGEYEPLDLGPDRVGFVRGGAIRVVVPLRPGDRADGGDRDLLPAYDQELSVLA